MLPDIPSDILWQICNTAWEPHILNPGDIFADGPCNEVVIKMSETSVQLRAFALSLLFKEVYNWKRGAYDGGAWPSTVWPYIRREYGPSSCTPIDDRDLLSTLPNLINTSQVKLRFSPYSPKGVPLPYLLAVSTLPALHTLKLQQQRFDDPKLIEVFVEMRQPSSLGLTLTELRNKPRVTDTRQEVDWEQEINVVSKILQFFFPTLVGLELSGDLIEFQTLAFNKWSKLGTLRLVDHIPYCDYQYLPIVVSQMPSLCTLHCNFNAEELPREPFIFCSSAEVHPPLSVVLPSLISLSLSNLQPGEKIVDQLPNGLKVLRVLALKDHRVPHTSPSNYSGLTDADVTTWVDAAVKLPFLVQLSLGLKSVPSPTLLAHMSRSCPGLEYLELEKEFFEYNNNELPPPILESFVEPLQNLPWLRELRMSVELGPSLVYIHPSGHSSPSEAFMDRAQESAMMFAKKLPKLEFIGFLSGTWNIMKFGCFCMWYIMEVVQEGGQINIKVAEAI
ncbi:hypothetical protein C0995_014673 [Termitomyces sp. Mi166|nr:hypothetical protein C0995_014673 [Termitomyces sp. Mi166\